MIAWFLANDVRRRKRSLGWQAYVCQVSEKMEQIIDWFLQFHKLRQNFFALFSMIAWFLANDVRRRKRSLGWHAYVCQVSEKFDLIIDWFLQFYKLRQNFFALFSMIAWLLANDVRRRKRSLRWQAYVCQVSEKMEQIIDWFLPINTKATVKIKFCANYYCVIAENSTASAIQVVIYVDASERCVRLLMSKLSIVFWDMKMNASECSSKDTCICLASSPIQWRGLKLTCALPKVTFWGEIWFVFSRVDIGFVYENALIPFFRSFFLTKRTSSRCLPVPTPCTC